MIRYASWGIIIDDIVFPDGETAMGVPGGAGLYAAMGMRLWTEDVTLISAVGEGFEAQIIEDLGLDTAGLQATARPTPRAWQLFEEDGRRTQIFRVPQEVITEQLVKAPLGWPLPQGIEAVHYMLRGGRGEEEMVRLLAGQDVRLSAEPIVDEQTTPAERDVILDCLPQFELFSPDEEGAALLAGDLPALQQVRAIAAQGPRIVCLRQGAAGSLIYERETDRAWRVPAAPAKVVDFTGAGNAYCGGFLVGWHEGKGIRQAAAQAAISAAVTIEQVGPPRVDDAKMAEAQARAAQVRGEIQVVGRGD